MLRLMEDSYCVEQREAIKETKHKRDIIKRLKPTLYCFKSSPSRTLYGTEYTGESFNRSLSILDCC